jgi:hypothetical protein
LISKIFKKQKLEVLEKLKKPPNTGIIISFQKTTGQPGLMGVQYFRTVLKAFSSNTRCTVLHSILVEPVLCM